MVDARQLQRVRIVRDRGTEEDDPPPNEGGTKVLDDVLLATPGSLTRLDGGPCPRAQGK